MIMFSVGKQFARKNESEGPAARELVYLLDLDLSLDGMNVRE